MNGISKALEALGNKIQELENEKYWKDEKIAELEEKIKVLEGATNDDL